MSDCVFCEIVDGTRYADIVREDEHTLAFEPLNPATEGHTLVVPKRHAGDLWDLESGDIAPLFEAVHEVGASLWLLRKPDGMNVIHSAGAAATQTVFHLHVHLVPRYVGDAMPPLWPHLASERLEALEEICQRVADGWTAVRDAQDATYWYKLNDDDFAKLTPEVAALLWPSTEETT